MSQSKNMNISASKFASALLRLPWHTPLEQWPEDVIVALPRGISRHVVRFVSLEEGPDTGIGHAKQQIGAVKEIGKQVAIHEYKMLRELQRLGVPSVVPVAVVSSRGEGLTAALVTEHLRFALPYREIFSSDVPADMAIRLIKALALLLVRLHLENFYWGDVSLSNTLFRRDADTFSAYLVDAETGEFQPELSRSRRLYDIEIARVNIIGELMDLQAGGFIDESLDAVSLGNQIESLYLDLWEELTAEEEVGDEDYWRVTQRIRKLEEMGFDVDEMQVSSTGAKSVMRVRPVVVAAGHYRRELRKLTGLDVGEQQARRLLEAIAAYRSVLDNPDIPTQLLAYKWMLDEYEPTITRIPKEMTEKLEPAQVFHEILDHRYYMAQSERAYVPVWRAAESYFGSVLPDHRDEAMLLTSAAEEDDVDSGSWSYE